METKGYITHIQSQSIDLHGSDKRLVLESRPAFESPLEKRMLIFVYIGSR